MNQTLTILSKTGPVDLSPLSDEIEPVFHPKPVSKIIIKGILNGDSLETISTRLFKKLPKNLETQENFLAIENLVKYSILDLLKDVDPKVSERFLQVNPGLAKKKLGELSILGETGGKGSSTVSSNSADPGGVSYGSYQLASKKGRPREFLQAEGKAWASGFAGIVPGTTGFTEKWREIARRDPEEFQQAQYDFIKRTHYDVNVKKILDQTGVDITRCSHALQEVVWSAAVQHGPDTSIVIKSIEQLQGKVDPDSAEWDRELIKTIYAERGRKNTSGSLVYFVSSPQRDQINIGKRFVRECAEAIRMLEDDNLTKEVK